MGAVTTAQSAVAAVLIAADTAASTAIQLMHRKRLMMRRGIIVRPVERNKSSCARAFIGYVRKLPHRFTYLVRRTHSVTRTKWPLAAITAATW